MNEEELHQYYGLLNDPSNLSEVEIKLCEYLVNKKIPDYYYRERVIKAARAKKYTQKNPQ